MPRTGGAAGPDVTDALPVLDPGRLNGFVASKAELRAYTAVFLAQAGADARFLALHSGDGAAFAETAHRLKGAAEMAGALRLAALCAAGQSMSDAPHGVRTALAEDIGDALQAVGIRLRENCDSPSFLNPNHG